jgi:drug/metabolite transporter (DMT)-like permease
MKNKILGGIGLSLIAGICFGAAVPLAALSYTQGADVFGYMLVVRTILAVGMAAVCFYHCKNFLPARGFMPLLLLMGGISAAFSALHFGAIAYMPVALVTMLIFLYPLFVSALSIIFDRVVPGWIFYAATVMALCGLYLVLGPQWDAFNWLGAGMAVMAAVLIATHIFLNGRILKNADPEVYGAQLMIVKLLCFMLLGVGFGAQWPHSALGWQIIVLAGVIVLIGQLAFFRAIQAAGAVQVALYIKIEPVATLILAAILLGENLTPVQIAGAGLVIAALVVNSLDKK